MRRVRRILFSTPYRTNSVGLGSAIPPRDMLVTTQRHDEPISSAIRRARALCYAFLGIGVNTPPWFTNELMYCPRATWTCSWQRYEMDMDLFFLVLTSRSRGISGQLIFDMYVCFPRMMAVIRLRRKQNIIEVWTTAVPRPFGSSECCTKIWRLKTKEF